ncbi:CD109 antigen [Gossypium arboreum]|uniref:CD109 antigen n=1 Tax=Gossypium arboreum TaxID=29729 RepID=A0A0B0NSL2_GOSAR|nr:CD109 antigen [Gossypium arboreum]
MCHRYYFFALPTTWEFWFHLAGFLIVPAPLYLLMQLCESSAFGSHHSVHLFFAFLTRLVNLCRLWLS